MRVREESWEKWRQSWALSCRRYFKSLECLGRQTCYRHVLIKVEADDTMHVLLLVEEDTYTIYCHRFMKVIHLQETMSVAFNINLYLVLCKQMMMTKTVSIRRSRDVTFTLIILLYDQKWKCGICNFVFVKKHVH